MPPHRVGFLRRFGLKTGIHFAHFGLESRVWFSSELREYMNVFIVSIPNELERKRNMRIRNRFELFFCLRPNLSNGNIISAYRPGFKTVMDVRGLF